MAEEVGDSSTLAGNFSAPIGAAILLVIGEPLTDDYRELILADITKGFQSWDKDATGIDISEELAEISSKADLGEEGTNGERIIRHRSDHISVEILINPQTPTVQHALKNLLITETRHKHMVYAGHGFQGSGAWILQDDTFTFGYFAHAFKDSDVENSLKKQEGCTFSVHTFPEGEWSNAHISKLNFSKLLHIKLNPGNLLDNASGILQFTAYVANFVKTTPVTNILQSSDVVGNIRFSRPTLYIFPGCHGDSALFGISGFNLLINGGYSRKACFWDFTRHLDRIDAVLLTHLGTDNLFGISSVLHRKSIQNVHPEIGFLYLNASDKFAHSITENVESKQPNLLINLAEEGSRIVEFSKQLGQIPHPCSRSNSTQHLEPVNLYHKVGHGSLDMYILNPVTDSKELKDFYQQWNKLVSTFGSQQHVPLPNMLSICALLVWKPADPHDSITRIFFPGNAPQHKVIEGLERMKTLSVLKHLKCCQNDLNKPATKKASSLTPRSAASKTTPRQPLTARMEIKKTDIKVKDDVKPTKSRSAPMTKRDKGTKEDVNKKTAKSMEKTDKQKSSASSSPSKTSSKSVTPSETPKEIVSPKKESEPAVGNLIDVSPIPDPHTLDHAVVNHINDDPKCMTESMHEAYTAPPVNILEDDVKLQSHESPEPLPDPSQFEAHSGEFDQEKLEQNHVPIEENVPVVDKHKMEELGIYDEEAAASHETEVKSEPVSPRMMHDDEFHPEALPDPVAYPSYIQEPDVIPGPLADREPSPEQELEAPTEIIKQEPDVVPASQEPIESPSQVDILTPPEETNSLLVEPVKTPDDLTEPSITQKEKDFGYDHEEHEHSKEEIESEIRQDSPSDQDREHSDAVLQREPITFPVSPADEIAEQQFAMETNEPQYQPLGHHDVDEEQDEKMAFEKHEESDLAAEQMLRDPTVTVETGGLTGHEQHYGNGMQTNMDMLHEDEGPLDVEKPVSQPCDYREEARPSDVDERMLGEGNLTERETIMENVSQELNQVSQEVDTLEKSAAESPISEPSIDPNTYVYEKDVDLSDEESEEDMQNQQVYQQQREDEEEALDNAEHQQSEIQDQYEQEDGVDEMVGQQTGAVVMESVERESFEEFAKHQQEEKQKDRYEQEDGVEEMVGLQTGAVGMESVERESFKEFAKHQQDEKQEDRYKQEDDNDLVAGKQTEGFGMESADKETYDEFAKHRPVEQDRCEQEEEVDKMVGQPIGAIEMENNEMVTSQEEFAGMQEDSLLQQDIHEREEEDQKLDIMQRDAVHQEDEEHSDNAMPELDFREVNKMASDPSDEEEEDEDEDTAQMGEDIHLFEKQMEGPRGMEDVEDQRHEHCDMPNTGSFEDRGFDSHEALQDDHEHEHEHGSEQLEVSSIPAAFEKDETPNPADLLPRPDAVPEHLDSPASDTAELFQKSEFVDNTMAEEEDTDSTDGGTPEDEKDIDGAFAAQNGGDMYPVPPNNQLDRMGQQDFNPFYGIDQQSSEQTSLDYQQQQHTTNPFGDKFTEDEEPPAQPTFDQMADWGKPMGLPSPPPPEESAAENKSPSKTKRSPLKNGTKTDLKKADATKAPSKSKAPEKRPGSLIGNKTTNGVADNKPARRPLSARTETKTHTRPATAPTRDLAEPKARPTSRRSTTATGSRSSPSVTKAPPLPPMTPFYVDLTYIPNHGNPNYTDIEFFKRVRARFYVLSSLSPNPQVLNALLDAKQTWEDKEIEVTVIPTYDNDTLRHWMALHKDRLNELKVDIAPSANRCTIQLQDHETSCSAYRLEF